MSAFFSSYSSAGTVSTLASAITNALSLSRCSMSLVLKAYLRFAAMDTPLLMMYGSKATSWSSVPSGVAKHRELLPTLMLMRGLRLDVFACIAGV